jgi:hypothetical protein
MEWFGLLLTTEFTEPDSREGDRLGAGPCRPRTADACWSPDRNGRTRMIYELRVYHCVPGRLPDLIKRFDTITLPLWEKHGIRQAGFWTTLVGESNQDLTYFLQWESLAEREAKMSKFGSDPEWLAARAKTEENGPIVASITNALLTPTSFSSVK